MPHDSALLELARRLADAPGVFVTGVDTGVGKTVLGAALLRALRETAPTRRLLPRKPAESGCRPWDPALDPTGLWRPRLETLTGDARPARPERASGSGLGAVAGVRLGADLYPDDAARLADAAGLGSPEACAAVCRYRFAAPLAPDQAAARVGQRLTLAALVDACRRSDGDVDAFVHVEGAGGYYSPLTNDGALNADLADALGLPIVLVAPDRLGVQSAVLLAVEAMQRRRAPLAAVLLNGWFRRVQAGTSGATPNTAGADWTAIGATDLPDNAAVLQARLDVPVLLADAPSAP